jgi:Ca-activated chloride channel family protein
LIPVAALTLNMRFLHPELATWLLALPLAVAWWTMRRYARVNFQRNAALGERAHAASRLSTAGTDGVALVAALLTFAALVVAAMRPQLLVEWRLPQFERRDLILVLDRSVSMRAADVQPTRFGRAVAEIKQFLDEKPADIDRVALVGFSNAAIAVSHFTRNVDSLFFYLDWMAEDTRPNFGTDIGTALLTASDIIAREKQPGNTVVLLISDGEDEGEVLSSAVTELRKKGVTLYSIGVGGSRPVNVPVPADDGVGDAGWALRVTFNEATLRSVAAAGGGRYYRSQSGHELLQAMRDLASRERRQLGWVNQIEYRDLHPYALGVAALAACALLVAL